MGRIKGFIKEDLEFLSFPSAFLPPPPFPPPPNKLLGQRSADMLRKSETVYPCYRNCMYWMVPYVILCK